MRLVRTVDIKFTYNFSIFAVMKSFWTLLEIVVDLFTRTCFQFRKFTPHAPISGLSLCYPSFDRRRVAIPQKVSYLRSLIHPPPPPPPYTLSCNAHLLANFHSFHMSLVVVMNSGAENALHSFEISMFSIFLKLYFIHISKDILPLRAQNAIKQCKWYISRKP